jgi:hypothetical protein
MVTSRATLLTTPKSSRVRNHRMPTGILEMSLTTSAFNLNGPRIVVAKSGTILETADALFDPNLPFTGVDRDFVLLSRSIAAVSRSTVKRSAEECQSVTRSSQRRETVGYSSKQSKQSSRPGTTSTPRRPSIMIIKTSRHQDSLQASRRIKFIFIA